MKFKYLKNVSTLELNREKCTGCGKCTDVCPHNVFRLSNGKAEIIDRDLCMECSACTKNCPFGALRVKQGVGCASYVISGILNGENPNCGGDSGCC